VDFQPPDRRGEPVACPIGISYRDTEWVRNGFDSVSELMTSLCVRTADSVVVDCSYGERDE